MLELHQPSPEIKVPEKKADREIPLPALETCPICMEYACFPWSAEADGVKRMWMLCECGTFFQVKGQEPLKEKDRTPDVEALKDDKARAYWLDRSTWMKRLYFPLIEDMQHGRKVLEYRFTHADTLEWMRNRGWLPVGVDDCPAVDAGDNPNQSCAFMDVCMVDPFRRFNLIWMADSIQSMEHPGPALLRAYGMLEKDGLLFVSAPDVSFFFRAHPERFGHFDPTANRLLMRGEGFAKLAERLGFETVLLRKSASRCGVVYDQFHWLGVRR